MSSLIYRLIDNQVCIAADTLLSNDRHEPFKYVTKILLLPNIRGVLCGTGSGDLLLRWYLQIQTDVIVPDLPWLGSRTPTLLQKLANELKLPSGMKTTIYHFGWDHRANRMVGQSFAAQECFALRDAHRDSLVVKPGYPSAMKDAGELVFQHGIAGFAQIMERQRQAEQQLTKDDGAGIGGEVHFVEITTNGVAQFLAHRFSDYHELYEWMLRKAHRFAEPAG